MKKIVSMTVVTLAALTLMSGCGAKGSSSGMKMGAADETVCKTAIFVGDRNSKSVISAIERAGEKEGWRMTEFKSNAIIAEKTIDSETYSTTISIAREHITCDKNNLSQRDLNKLRSAIVEELQKNPNKH